MLPTKDMWDKPHRVTRGNDNLRRIGAEVQGILIYWFFYRKTLLKIKSSLHPILTMYGLMPSSALKPRLWNEPYIYFFPPEIYARSGNGRYILCN